MDVNYTLHDTNFEWDDQKAIANLSNHHVPFETACEAFFDPFFCVVGAETVDGEEREALIGMTIDWRVLYVVYTIRADVIRIISARLTTTHERTRYEEQ